VYLVGDLTTAYWASLEEQARFDPKAGRFANIRDAIKVLRKLYGRVPVAKFGPKSLKAVRQAMLGKDWSRPYVNQQISYLKTLFKWGCSEELVPPDVYHGLLSVSGLRKGERGARETKKIKPVPEAFLVQAIPHMPRPVQAMVQLQLLCGCRPDEIVRLRACDLDMTGEVWEYRLDKHKTEEHGIQRRVYFGPGRNQSCGNGSSQACASMAAPR
jgi:integrase